MFRIPLLESARYFVVSSLHSSLWLHTRNCFRTGVTETDPRVSASGAFRVRNQFALSNRSSVGRTYCGLLIHLKLRFKIDSIQLFLITRLFSRGACFHIQLGRRASDGVYSPGDCGAQHSRRGGRAIVREDKEPAVVAASNSLAKSIVREWTRPSPESS